MALKFLERFLKRERGFTLIEMTATVVILSVIGLAVLNVTGNGNLMLARQSNEMDSRISARAVLTRIVKDIETAKATVVPDEHTIQIMDLVDGNWVVTKTYGFDSEKKQVYLRDNSGNDLYLINAISYVVYYPETTQPNTANYVNMDITVSVGSSQLTFNATATSRSVNTNSTPIPDIWYVSPNPTGFGWGTNGHKDIEIHGLNTHFTTATQVVLVRAVSGVTFDPKNFDLSTGSSSGQDIVVIKNTQSNPSRVTIPQNSNGLVLNFRLNQADVVDQATYHVYAFTPNVVGINGNSSTEIVYKLSALGISIDPTATNSTPSTPNPNQSPWSEGDWDLDRGSGGFGSIDLLNKRITKDPNANGKIAYYATAVTTFDYRVRVRINSGAGLALLTLFYDGGKKGTYIGYGIDQTGVYYGQSGALTKIRTESIGTNEVLLRAKADYNSDVKMYRLRVWFKGLDDTDRLLTTSYIPSDPVNGLPAAYLGVTVPDKKTDVTFTAVNLP